MNKLVRRFNSFLSTISFERNINYLTEDELNRLVHSFENYLGVYPRHKRRYKYWLVFLFLRFTGARVSEVLSIDDMRDIDIRNSEVKLPILKRRKKLYKVVPIPDRLVSEYLRIIKLYPEFEGNVFKIDRSNFYKVFSAVCRNANIDRKLSHPHILRHTRAVELVKSGIPITIIQKLLGHYSLNNTAIYLQFSANEIKDLMKMKGLL